MKQENKHTYQINGHIIDAKSKRGIEGLRVEAWDKDLIFNDLVGSDRTDVEGGFRIEFSGSYFRELFFDRQPDLFFKVFSGRKLIKSTRDSVMWNVRAGLIPVEIAIEWASDQTGDETLYTVSGTVTSPGSAGTGGLRVEIVDKNIKHDYLLAETSTESQGLYHASFTALSLRERGKRHPDLQARVFAGQTFLAASEVRYNATEEVVLNVSLPANSVGLPSEYETLIAALAAYYEGHLGDLKEAGDRQDITYLANKTGWDARAVALAALADQFSRHSVDQSGAAAIHPALYYALFRVGLPANPDTLYQAESQMVERIWKQAIEQAVIPKAMSQEIQSALGAFRQLGAQKLLTSPALAGVSSFKEMLAISSLGDAQQQKFAELYTANKTDLSKFWKAVEDAFDADTAKQLQVDGKLAFLTINNAPLMLALRQALRDANGSSDALQASGLSDPVQLAQQGYHRASNWMALLNGNVNVPKEIPGDTPVAQRSNYAEYLAAQVRLSYPTASIAEMVRGGDIKVDASSQVDEFLTAHQGKFEIGMLPVQQYIKRNNLEVAEETVTQIKRLQRVYQITPNDQSLIGLMKRNIDAASHVVRQEREAFIKDYSTDLGGEKAAEQTYDKSLQVHNAVLNIAISYLTAKNSFSLGAAALAGRDSGLIDGQILQPKPKGPDDRSAGDVIAYPTLDTLFGEMDFCNCDHCRSILSPAAYLVDLLFFLDQAPTEAGKANPQTILLEERRPDIQHLPLTCENTNTAMPYIDVVNETLEYFIANSVRKLSLSGYVGHDTDGASSEDLLASPQFVIDSAYSTLGGERFPFPLPFHQPLENLRRYFDKFEVPLTLAMERLRKSDALERGANPYGWRDILMEELCLSRAEHQLLTDVDGIAPDPDNIPLWQLYGFANGTTDATIVAELSNAKKFTRRVGITYEEITDILKTRFINPNSDLVPKLERLGVPFAALKALKDGTITDAQFDALLAAGAGAPDPAEYDNDIKKWVVKQENYDRIMSLITLTDPTANNNPCNFDTLEFRYARPMAELGDTSTRLGVVEFIRLLRFIRLWKKLGWTIEQTDAAICALFPVPPFPDGANAINTKDKLDAGFLTLLPRLGIVVRVMHALNLGPKRDLLPLLACWSPLGTHGDTSLYRQMFLNPALLAKDAAFADNGYGEFLKDNTQKLLAHAEALRSAFNLSADEFERIIAALGFDVNTALNFETLSAVYRSGWLARKLKISVQELLRLIQLTGLNLFAAPDPTNPAILRLIELLQAQKARSLKSAAALYLIWNQDPTGKSAPDPAQVTEFARTLRADFATIEEQFSVTEDPGGDIARARMTLVYGTEVTNAFFALLDGTLALDVPYTHPLPTLEAAIRTADPKIAYDDFRHRLLYTGTLSAAKRDALKAVPIVMAAFQNAVDALFAQSEDAQGSFFALHAELKPFYDSALALDATLVLTVDYTHSAAALEAAITAADPRISYNNATHKLSYDGTLTPVRRDTLKNLPGVAAEFQSAMDALFILSQEARGKVLAGLQPELARRRKRQQALQRFSAAANTDLSFTQAVLDPPAAPYPLHADGRLDKPALNDVLALETPGLAAQFFFRDTATGAVDLSVPAAANLDYASGGSNPLPSNPVPGVAISGIWRGQVEAPETGFYNFVVEADLDATVTLRLGGQARALIQNGKVWRNNDPLELKAGTLYEIELTVNKFKTTLSIKWETPKRAREVITARYLYPPAILPPFTVVYIRFLKTASLVQALRLTANEISRFATDADYLIDGDGWLNALAVTGDPASLTAAALLKPFRDLLDFARIKSEISPDDESLLTVLQNPAAATTNPDSLLYTIARWDKTSLDDLLTHFGNNIAGLSHFDQFRRAYDAFALIQKMGISASALIKATTNEPTGSTVRDLQAALRARYEAADWRTVVQPLNDEMRALQRDALVAYILHQMRANPATEQIDTADKLFEYFLMDIEMEPCMQTSRIRHALSSVQLFIERCFMNLEPRVALPSDKSKQWEWMKRYRVWEANRKVFLFPENWLEPELRDDKSPFFKEIESELLQSDITEDSAATALLNYLTKLSEVAMMEPCGIYHVEADPNTITDDIDHVIARTTGASRKYYYRRRESGSWTPWEQIKLDIEDNPVIPVVWKGRTLLLWLRILKQTPIDANDLPESSDTAGSLGSLTLTKIKADAKSSVKKNAKVTIQAVLCWSEFYNGKWQPAKTSDIDKPTILSTSDGVNDFDRSTVKLSTYEEGPNHFLRIEIEGDGYTTFLLYNTHSLPMREEDVSHEVSDMYIGPRYLDTHTDAFNIEYYNFDNGSTLKRPILSNPLKDRTLETAHPLKNIWVAPFFYQDGRHVFYVTTAAQLVFLNNYPGYAVEVNPGYTLVDPNIPPLVIGVKPNLTKPPRWGDGDPVKAGLGVTNPDPMRRFLSEDAFIHQGIGALGNVLFGGRLIGPAGLIMDVSGKR